MLGAGSSTRGIGLLLMVLGGLISTAHISGFYYSYDAPKWWVFDLGLAFCLCFFSLHHRVSPLQLGALGCANLAIICLSLASLLWAPNVYAGLEWAVRYCLASLFVATLATVYSREQLRGLILGVIVGSSLLFVIVLIVERYVLRLPRNVGAFSPIGFQNNAGQVFNIWIPLLTYLLLSNIKRPIALVYFATLLVITVLLVEAATRGSILGLLFGELFLFALLLKKEKKRALRFLSITTLVVFAVFLSQQVEFLKSDRLTAKFSHMRSGIAAASGQRIPMFENTWRMTLDNPIGVGANNFEYIHPKYARVGVAGENSPFVNAKTILRTPHNYPLKIFSEIGLIGGLLTLMVYFFVCWRGLVNALKGDFLDKWLLVSIVAVGFHSLVSGVFSNPASLFFSALLIALVLNRYQKTVTIYLRLPVKKLLLWQGTVIPILSCMWLSSQAYAYQGRRHGDVDRLQQALVLNPGNERAWYDLAKIRYQKYRDARGSLQAIARFIDLYPYHIQGLYIKAQREAELQEWYSAKYSIDRLLSFYPSYKPAQSLRMRIHQGLRVQQSSKNLYQNGESQ